MGWAINASQGLIAYDIPHVSGRFYDSRISGASSTFTIASGTLYGVPFQVPLTQTYATIGIEVTSLSAGAAHLGIYKDSGGTPGSLVVDAGTINTGTTGAKNITINQSLTAAWYWLALLGNATPTFRGLSNGTSCFGWLGYTSGTDTTTHAMISVAQTYGALPDPFTGGFALTSGVALRLMLGV